jgi:hypothetical protein
MPQVVYELSLKDHLTSNLHTADGAARGLEGTISSIEKRLLHVGEGFAVSFGMWKGFEFAKDSLQESEKLVQAQAMLKAGLESTGYAAGLTAEQLETSMKRISAGVNYSEGQITDLQSMLVTFPAITKQNFDDATMSIVDMSARMHQDLKESAVEVGKALQDPIKGMMALRRVGVNFNETQTEMVKRMVATGHAAEAQTFILSELHKEFSGSAAAAFNADPMAQFNKAVEDIQYSLGGVIAQVLHDVTPALVELIGHIKDMADWVKKNWDLIESLVKALGIAYLTFKTISLAVASYEALMEGLAAAEAVATTATEGLATATTSLAGPIGLIAGEIAGLVELYNQLSISANDASAAMNKYNPETAKSERSVLDAQTTHFKKFGYDDESAKYAAYNEEKQSLNAALKIAHEQYDKIKKTEDKYGLGLDVTGDARVALAKIAAYNSQMQEVDKYLAAPKKVGSNPSGTIAPGKKPETKGAKGNKNETINIHIDNLIKGFSINTTNLKESSGKVQEMITQALMNAVNNSQLIADH